MLGEPFIWGIVVVVLSVALITLMKVSFWPKPDFRPSRLRNEHGSLPERLQVGELMLDCIRRKVTRSGDNIELAPKEFSILEYLMRNPGRPLSRTMIVEHVWDMDYDGLTNIVDVYIRHLRSKIDDRYPVKMIHTVRGIGYMLESPERAVA